MNRRNLIKTLGISAVGLATVPVWMDAWSAERLPETKLGLNGKQLETLGAIVDAIIPTSEIPGAKELQVEKFIDVMVADCYPIEVQDQFIAGLERFAETIEKSHMKSFGQLQSEVKTAILVSTVETEKSSEVGFKLISFLKTLTVSGYMSSEYIAVNILNYEMVPSRWNGSFLVSDSKYHKE